MLVVQFRKQSGVVSGETWLRAFLGIGWDVATHPPGPHTCFQLRVTPARPLLPAARVASERGSHGPCSEHRVQ